MMSGLDGSGVVHTVWPWEAFVIMVSPRRLHTSILRNTLQCCCRVGFACVVYATHKTFSKFVRLSPSPLVEKPEHRDDSVVS